MEQKNQHLKERFNEYNNIKNRLFKTGFETVWNKSKMVTQIRPRTTLFFHAYIKTTADVWWIRPTATTIHLNQTSARRDRTNRREIHFWIEFVKELWHTTNASRQHSNPLRKLHHSKTIWIFKRETVHNFREKAGKRDLKSFLISISLISLFKLAWNCECINIFLYLLLANN